MTEEAVSADISTPFAAEDGAPQGVIASHPSDDNLYPSIIDAAAEGDLVVTGLRSGVLSTINAGVRTLVATAKFRGDIEAVTAFMGPLVKAKVFSPSEARLGLASPKLSRLCKIGEYADWLRNENIIRYFFETGCSGPTVVYQVAVLLDQMPDNLGDEERIEQLVETLRRGQVHTRQGMLRLTRELKSAKRGLGASLPNSIETRLTDQDSGGDARYAVPVHVEEGSDLVLAMPDRSDLRKLREDYVDPPRCLRVGETIADDAVMIVVAALSDLPVIENYFLPYVGFEGIAPRLFLSRLPAGPEVTEAQVIIVADRGSGDRARLSEIVWPAEGETIDPLTLAAQLVPDARKKLALFASENTDGWQSIVGDANWGQVDG